MIRTITIVLFHEFVMIILRSATLCRKSQTGVIPRTHGRKCYILKAFVSIGSSSSRICFICLTSVNLSGSGETHFQGHAPVSGKAIKAVRVVLDMGRQAEVCLIEVSRADLQREELGEGRRRAKAPMHYILRLVVRYQMLSNTMNVNGKCLG